MGEAVSDWFNPRHLGRDELYLVNGRLIRREWWEVSATTWVCGTRIPTTEIQVRLVDVTGDAVYHELRRSRRTPIPVIETKTAAEAVQHFHRRVADALWRQQEELLLAGLPHG